MIRTQLFLALSISLIAGAAFATMPVMADETIEAGYRGCAFNDAIRAANTNQPVGNCRAGDPGHDHIFVDGVVKILEPAVTITEDLSIVGDRDASTLDGQGRFSFFHVGPGVDLHLQDLVMSKGYGTSETGQARLESGAGIYFSTAQVINCTGVKDILAADDALVHFGYAAKVCGKMAPFNPHAPIRPLPGPNDNRPHASRSKPERKPVTVAKPAVHTCEHLPENMVVHAVAGTRSGIQCNVIDESGVGMQSVIDQGIIAAVDIWGYVAPGVEACLRGHGSLIFLDAAYSPRRIMTMPSYQQGDMTCASFNRAGSLVLVSAGVAV